MFEKILNCTRRYHGLEFVAFRYFKRGRQRAPWGRSWVETHLIPERDEGPPGQGPLRDLRGTDYPTPDGTCIRDYIT